MNSTCHVRAYEIYEIHPRISTVPGGIVALDDYMSLHWLGVTRGVLPLMASQNRRLKPFLYFQNKLFLTTVSEHALSCGNCPPASSFPKILK
jgi:hypothetical protein